MFHLNLLVIWKLTSRCWFNRLCLFVLLIDIFVHHHNGCFSFHYPHPQKKNNRGTCSEFSNWWKIRQHFHGFSVWGTAASSKKVLHITNFLIDLMSHSCLSRQTAAPVHKFDFLSLLTRLKVWFIHFYCWRLWCSDMCVVFSSHSMKVVYFFTCTNGSAYAMPKLCFVPIRLFFFPFSFILFFYLRIFISFISFISLTNLTLVFEFDGVTFCCEQYIISWLFEWQHHE